MKPFGVEFIFVRVRGKVGFNSLPADYKKENFKPVGKHKLA